LSSILVLFCISQGLSQLSEKPFLKRSNALLGLSYSRMLGDTIYDQDLLRFQFGYMYDAANIGKLDLSVGAMYRVKGGKSFFYDNYQTFTYLSIPISLSYPISGGSAFGLSAQPSYLLFNETRVRGTRSLLSPSPYPRYPSSSDLTLSPFFELTLTKTVKLNLTASYSLGSTTDNDTRLNFGGLSANLKLNFGQAVRGFEDLLDKGRDKKHQLLLVEEGAVIVILNKKTAVARYLREKGDTAKASDVLKDAKLKNRALMQAFAQEFKFTEVWFVYNTQVSSICAGDSTQQLISATGEKSSVAMLGTKEFVLFNPGDIYLKLQSFSGEGYFFQNSHCERLSDPFPTQMGIKSRPSNFNEMVKGLNKRLESRADLLREKSDAR